MRSSHIRVFFIAALLLAPAMFAATNESLSLVPADATTVGFVRLDDLRTNPMTARLFAEADKATAEGDAAKFMADAGLKPSEDVDAALMAVSPGAGDTKVLVAFEGRFDPARLSAAVMSRGAAPVQTPSGTFYLMKHEGEKGGAVAFVSSHLVLAGSEDAVREALDARAAKGTQFMKRAPLSRELKEIDPRATAWLIVDVQRSRKTDTQPGLPGKQNDAMVAALKNVSFVNVWAKGNAESIEISAFARSSDAETRELLEDALRGLLATWRLTVQEKAPELIPMIRRFEVDRDRQGVSLTGTVTREMIEKLQQKHREATSEPSQR